MGLIGYFRINILIGSIWAEGLSTLAASPKKANLLNSMGSMQANKRLKVIGIFHIHTGSIWGNIATDDSDPDVGLVGTAGLRLVPKDLGGGGSPLRFRTWVLGTPYHN